MLATLAAICVAWYAAGYLAGLATVRILHGNTVPEDFVWACVFAWLGAIMLFVLFDVWRQR
jgi:hypothetical protein